MKWKKANIERARRIEIVGCAVWKKAEERECYRPIDVANVNDQLMLPMLSTNWCCQCYRSSDAADVTDIVAHVRRILGEEEAGEK